MKMQRLGSSGPEISIVGYGAWEAGGVAWGPNPPDAQVIEAMEVALDNGMTWIDTAEAYGDGKSEELVRRAVKGRDDALIFTKLAPIEAGSGFHARGVRKGAEASLQRLGRDVIDLYQLHWPDDDIPIEETWEAMAKLVDDGRVRYIGVSNFNAELIERCEKIRHVDSLQPHFSMLWRKNQEIFPLCRSNGTGILAYGPLGFGLLAGSITKDTKFSRDDWRGGGHGMDHYEQLFTAGKLEKNLDIVESLRPVADRLDITLAQLALAWVFQQDGLTAAIAGSRSPKHVTENAGAGTVELSDEDLGEVESLLASSSD